VVNRIDRGARGALFDLDQSAFLDKRRHVISDVCQMKLRVPQDGLGVGRREGPDPPERFKDRLPGRVLDMGGRWSSDHLHRSRPEPAGQSRGEARSPSREGDWSWALRARSNTVRLTNIDVESSPEVARRLVDSTSISRKRSR
jgi:hypothetical protein